MENGIILTINLPGRIGGSVRHTETQTVKVQVIHKGKVIWVSRKIVHNDRGEQNCVKKTWISAEVVNDWMSDSIPSFSNKKEWAKLTKQQRLVEYVSRFDEGYGISVESI